MRCATWIAPAALAACLLVTILQNRAPAPPPQDRPVGTARWEYHDVQIPMEPSERKLQALNALGEQGWELITAAPVVRGEPPYEAVLTFKRQK